jgi:hypothetical protein
MSIVFKEVLNIDKEVSELTTEELIKLIRKYHQIDLYTVDEYWCLQLFDLTVCPNDINVSCDWENDDKELNTVLIMAIEYIAECIYDN